MESLFQILTNAADGAFVIDEEQHIVYWNQAAQEILEYTPDEVIGRNCYEILRGRDDRDQAICRHHCHVATTAFTGSSVTTYDTCVRTKSGEVRWINVSILTFPNSDNFAPLVVHLFRDATQEKQNEQFARQVLSAAERLRESSIAQSILSTSIGSPDKDLTGREREVLSLLAQGLSTRDIAQTLSISPSTTRNHVQNILHKLQVHSRVEAVAYAFEHGLINRE
jgi:PAS domain S-box-containing protein